MDEVHKGSEQMKVYIIEAYYCNGESEVKGVFSTFEKAKAYYDEHLKMDKNNSYTINEWTIDTSESSGKWWGTRCWRKAKRMSNGKVEKNTYRTPRNYLRICKYCRENLGLFIQFSLRYFKNTLPNSPCQYDVEK